ncbi:hypothetical protein ACJMK2_006523 [Sinanodonta woodiana]|uniref:G-protein coupled receptors family 1 profile domain-containing protein n=1 Tax=Sinanodonta woodiana TaxID=1069815 RepID=A0ABD3VTG1_SINWO
MAILENIPHFHLNKSIQNIDIQMYSAISYESNYIGTNISYRDHVCDSNSSMWMMTTPLCSLKYSSFFVFFIVALLLAIITLWTIIGNILVLLALYKFKKLRSMSNCLIGNLAISDLLLAISVLPISATYDLLGYWVFGELMCTIWLCIDVLYCTASIWGLCTIAVDRYTATVYPVWYHERKSPTRALVYVIFVWLFSIIVSIAPFIGWRDMIPSFFHYEVAINRYQCVLFSKQSYVVYSAMGSFVIPTCLMVFLYVRIFYVLKQRSRSMQPIRKRVLYPSESDFESDGAGLDDQESDENNVELRAVATQTTPINMKRHSRTGTQENGFKVSSNLNGNNVSPRRKSAPEIDGNRINRPDLIKHTQVEPVQKRASLTIEVTDTTTISVIAKIEAESESHVNGTPVTSTLRVPDESHGQSSKIKRTPSERSKKSITNDDSSDLDSEARCLRKKHSKSIFFPWSARHARGSTGLGVRQKYELREQRATKRMAMIIGCFCVCWWPFLFMYTIRSFCQSCEIDPHFQATIIWLGYANSSLNPILYTIFNEDFRKAFQRILGCYKQTRRTR